MRDTSRYRHSPRITKSRMVAAANSASSYTSLARNTWIPWWSGLVMGSSGENSWDSSKARFSFSNRGAPVSHRGGSTPTPFSSAAWVSSRLVRSTKANSPVPSRSWPSVHRDTTTWSARRRICTSTFRSWAVNPSKESTPTVHPAKKSLSSRAWARRVRSSRESK